MYYGSLYFVRYDHPVPIPFLISSLSSNKVSCGFSISNFIQSLRKETDLILMSNSKSSSCSLEESLEEVLP